MVPDKSYSYGDRTQPGGRMLQGLPVLCVCSLNAQPDSEGSPRV